MGSAVPAKPSAKSLAKGARAFVRENLDYFKLYIRPLIVPVMLCLIVAQIAGTYFNLAYLDHIKADPKDVTGAFRAGASYFLLLIPVGIFGAYLQACFALSWHRAVLIGPNPGHAVNPFRLKPGEGGFIGAFFLIALVPLLFGMGGGLLVGLLSALHSPILAALASIAMFGLLIYGIITSMRMMFMLPARSVNARISWHEARQISRGLLWKLIAAGFWWIVLVALLFGLWQGIANAIGSFIFHRPVAMGVAGSDHPSAAQLLYIFIFIGLPNVFVRFYLTAFSVTILSRLYQWSVQNRPIMPKVTESDMP